MTSRFNPHPGGRAGGYSVLSLCSGLKPGTLSYTIPSSLITKLERADLRVNHHELARTFILNITTNLHECLKTLKKEK